MRVYIKGNYIDPEGRGHHGETLDLSDWVANKLIASSHAVEESVWLEQQERQQTERQQAEEAEAERRVRIGAEPRPSTPDATQQAPQASGFAGGVMAKPTNPSTVSPTPTTVPGASSTVGGGEGTTNG